MSECGHDERLAVHPMNSEFSFLHIQIVSIRNLHALDEGWSKSMDVYCTMHIENDFYFRSKTKESIDIDTASWACTIPLSDLGCFPIATAMKKPLLTITMYLEKNMYFDMFSSSEDEEDDADNGEENDETTPIGRVSIPLSILSHPLYPERDRWWALEGVPSGEIRIRSSYTKTTSRREVDELRNNSSWPRRRPRTTSTLESRHLDVYGFPIPEASREEWQHLQSYVSCREARQIELWDDFLSSVGIIDLPSQLPIIEDQDHQYQNEDHHQNQDHQRFHRLVEGGIPRHLRESVYGHVTGANAIKALMNQQAKESYYPTLLSQVESLENTTTRQIELDLHRTFAHSHTKLSTKTGQNALRRVLRAYALHNPAIGYCQGLNFIAGFLLLIFEHEENVFYLLAALCERYFPGYYTPEMLETQVDLLVLKDIFADQVPALDAHAQALGIPLELIASQWLLCLFTTTFPAETTCRILDLIFVKGPYFIFAVTLAHLRCQQPALLDCPDFQSMLNHLKHIESNLLDPDILTNSSVRETKSHGLTRTSIEALKIRLRPRVTHELERVEELRRFQSQIATVGEIPAFAQSAVQLLRFCHEEAEMTARADVAFLLTLLCHGLVWFAEHSKRISSPASSSFDHQ